MKIYKTHQQVLSQHCDATGIVHFPRYHEMAHEVLERWFDEALDWSFARMLGADGAAVPVVRAAAEFPRASRLGDHLVWRLAVDQIGRSSMDLTLRASCGGETRVTMQISIVLSDTQIIRPRQWPEPVRSRAADYLEESAPA